MTETRFVNCETCGTEGMIEHGHPNAPDPEWADVCPDCHGECVVEVEVEPVTLEEAEEMMNAGLQMWRVGAHLYGKLSTQR